MDRRTDGALESGSISVLVVDDDDLQRQFLARLLARAGIGPLFWATNGRSALEAFHEEQHPIDVVVCDLLMPRMDGVQLFNSAVEHDSSYRRRFVFVTGASSVLYIRKFLDTVNCQVVHKPVDADVLVRAIRLAAVAGGVFDTSTGPSRNADER